jgi:hypothetical protein
MAPTKRLKTYAKYRTFLPDAESQLIQTQPEEEVEDDGEYEDARTRWERGNGFTQAELEEEREDEELEGADDVEAEEEMQVEEELDEEDDDASGAEEPQRTEQESTAAESSEAASQRDEPASSQDTLPVPPQRRIPVAGPVSEPPKRADPDYVKKLMASLESLNRPNTPEAARLRWLKKRQEEGLMALIEDALGDENVLAKLLSASKKRIMREVLASMDDDLLNIIIGGNLAEYATQSGIKAELERLSEQATVSPGCYLQLFVDKEGKSPSPNMIKAILKLLRQYIGEEPGDWEGWSEEIDAVMRGGRQVTLAVRRVKRFRKYFYVRPGKDKPEKLEPSPTRVKRVKQFVRAIEKRLAEIPVTEHDEPLALPLSEVGYANGCHNRLDSHAKHDSSNYIMTLVEAVSIWAKDQGELGFDKDFRIPQFIIYNCWQVEQGVIAEIVLSRLCHAYIYNGGGFSHYPAGLSNDTCRAKNPYWEGWYELIYYAKDNTPLIANLKRDRELVREWRIQELDKKRAKIDALKQVHDMKRRAFAAEIEASLEAKKEQQRQQMRMATIRNQMPLIRREHESMCEIEQAWVSSARLKFLTKDRGESQEGDGGRDGDGDEGDI